MLTTACFYDPIRHDVTRRTGSDTVGPLGTRGFADEPLRRQVELTIPANAVEGAVSGVVGIGGSTGTRPPFPDVRLEIGGPVDGEVIVKDVGRFHKGFGWDLPTDCTEGCTVVFPVSFQQVEDGDAPRLTWSLTIQISYKDEPPVESEDIEIALVLVD